MKKAYKAILFATLLLLASAIWATVRWSQGQAPKQQVSHSDPQKRPDPATRPNSPDRNTQKQSEKNLQDAGANEKLVRDVYARLMRYQAAARDALAGGDSGQVEPNEYLTVELRDIRSGPISEIYLKPLTEMLTPRSGDLLNVKPVYFRNGDNIPHAYYEVEWGAAPTTAQLTIDRGPHKESLDKPATGGDRLPDTEGQLPSPVETVADMLGKGGNKFADVQGYTSYQVTIRLGGKQRTYRALVLYHLGSAMNWAYQTEAERSDALAHVEVLDSITSEINTVLTEQAALVRSPWEKYVKSNTYLAIARAMRETKQQGRPLRPADAPLGYLPGDGVKPTKIESAMLVAAASCDSPPTVTIKEVGFKGDHKIKRFSDGSTIDPNDDSPTWVKDRSNNNDFPVAYTRGTKPTIFAKVTVQQANSSYSTATVRVKNGDTVMAEVPGVNISQNGDVTISNIPFTVDLPDSSAVKMSQYTFTWEISFTGSSWTSMGNSGQHELHWLYAAPILPAFMNPDSATNPTRTYDGLYDIALRHSTSKTGDGSTNIDDLAEKITVGVKDDLIYNPGRLSQDRNPLTIYVDSDHSQQCSDNVALLRGLLRSIGIECTVNYFWGGNPTTKVSNWFVEPGYLPDVRPGFPNGSTVTSQYPRPVRNGVPPDPYFTFHSTLRAGSGKSFDPSYGIIEPEVSVIQAVNDSGQCLTGSAANAARVISTTLITQLRDFGIVCSAFYRQSFFMDQVVPTSMTAGTSYPVSITFRNTGAATWNTADAFRLGSQNAQDNSTWGLNRVNVPTSVAEGEVVTFLFTVTAPATAGTYNFQWRMVQDGVEWFGDTTPNLVITVSAPTPVCNPTFAQLRACSKLGGYWDYDLCECQGVGIP
ncbi:MAG TPA: NBR1-Ig-like domain-containing protein [Pyrinomonadaceae bacterium]|nr:NBR1-Ig-like domain-containing protein [Pyrinomonadaceae bacterium]